MINTVLGPIQANELGKTYMHEHVYADLSGVRADEDSLLTNSTLAIQEFSAATNYGIKSIIDVSCIGMGRNANELVKISEKLKANIICATGYYLTAYYPDYIATTSAEELSKIMINDIEVGVDKTDIKAGIIGEIATAKNEFTGLNKKVFEAAAIAQKQTGVPITTHCSAGTMAFEQAEFLIQKGAAPEKIILGHIDLSQNMDEALRALSLGVNVAFDTIGKVSYMSDETRAKHLAILIEKGFISNIVLSQDISRASYYKNKGGHGYGYFFETFVPLLNKQGITNEQIDYMLCNNPKRILDVGKQKITLSSRIGVLVDCGVVSKNAFEHCENYINYLSSVCPIDTKHSSYEQFETHAAMSFQRVLNNEEIQEMPDMLFDEIKDSPFSKIALTSVENFCKTNNLNYSQTEARYFALHLGVLNRQD